MKYIIITIIIIAICFFAIVVVVGLSASGATYAQYSQKTAIKNVQKNENLIIDAIEFFSQNIPNKREITIGYYIQNKIIDSNRIGYFVKEKDSVLDKGYSYDPTDIINGLTITDEVEVPMLGFKNLGKITRKMKQSNLYTISNTNPITFEYGMDKGGSNGFVMYYSNTNLDSNYIQIGEKIYIKNKKKQNEKS